MSIDPAPGKTSNRPGNKPVKKKGRKKKRPSGKSKQVLSVAQAGTQDEGTARQIQAAKATGQSLDFASLVKDPELPFLLDVGNGSKTLMVAFAGLSGAVGIYAFEFFNITRQFDVDKIFIRDLSQSWYLKGLKGLTQSLAETGQYLKGLIKQHQYENVVFLGNSMGGSAAIAHGVLAGANVILSFAPQTFLDAANRGRHGDNRWPQQVASLPAPADTPGADLKALLDALPYEGKIHIFYATDERIDKVHAEYVATCHNVELHECREGGHLLVQNMKKSGRLYRVLRDALTRSVEDRLLSVWKDQADIGTAEALQRHGVSAGDFAAYVNQHGELGRAQQALLLRFFSDIDSYIPRHFALECVNAKVPEPLRHGAEFCRRWFSGQKKQFFGSFFAMSDPHLLLHVELGTQNLHIGLVKCQRDSQGHYSTLPMQDEDFAQVLQTYGVGLPETLKLARRDWGLRWCSVDCGRFDNPEMYGTYKAMADFEHSIIGKAMILPFIAHLLAVKPSAA